MPDYEKIICKQAGDTAAWAYLGELKIDSHNIDRRSGDPWETLGTNYWIRAFDPYGIKNSWRFIMAGTKPLVSGGNSIRQVQMQNHLKFWATKAHDYRNATQYTYSQMSREKEFKDAFNTVVQVRKKTGYDLNL